MVYLEDLCHGTFTNPSLPKYLEPEIVIVTDSQADEQAVLEATRAGVPVIALSNSDNITSKVDLVIPSNNRGKSSGHSLLALDKGSPQKARKDKI